MRKLILGIMVLLLMPSLYSQTKITHSTSENIWTGGSATCSASGVPYENHFLRRFDLQDFPEIVDTAFYVAIEYGVESTSGGPFDVLVYLYDLHGDFLFSNMVLDFWEVSSIYPDSTKYHIRHELSSGGYALPTDTVVVDLYTPTGGTATFYPGANPLYESDSSYIAASTCGIYEPTTYGSIGFPAAHLVLHLWANQKPIEAPINISCFKNDTLHLLKDDFSSAFMDYNLGDTLNAIRITALPSNGILKLNDTEVNVGDVINSTELDSLHYIPLSGYFGADIFEYKIRDNYHWSNASSMGIINIINWMVGLEEIDDILEVYPNPASNFIQINSADVNASKLYDTRGEIIKAPMVSNRMEVGHLARGVYYLEITLESGNVQTYKIVLQ